MVNLIMQKGYVFVAVLVLLACCKRESLHGTDRSYAGKYRWIYRSGGFFPSSETPASGGYTMQLTICENGKYTMEKNDKKIFAGPMVKDEDGYLTFLSRDRDYKINFINEYAITKRIGDTITVDCRRCADNYYYVFVKE